MPLRWKIQVRSLLLGRGWNCGCWVGLAGMVSGTDLEQPACFQVLHSPVCSADSGRVEACARQKGIPNEQSDGFQESQVRTHRAQRGPSLLRLCPAVEFGLSFTEFIKYIFFLLIH